MLFYLALFFALLYFKIARVHKKEQRVSSSIVAQHFVVGFAVVSLLAYGFMYENLYWFLPLLFLFAIIASLMITAIQLGIFVNGKPLFGMTHFYRYFSILSIAIVLLTVALWMTHTPNI